MIKRSGIQSKTVLQPSGYADVTSMSSAQRTFHHRKRHHWGNRDDVFYDEGTSGGGHICDVSMPAEAQDSSRLNVRCFYHTCEYNTALIKNACLGNRTMSDLFRSLYTLG